ncbi:GNAT family N-acetyltransferase [Actinocatenispora rupis]|uniref:Ribosomal-protein-alanine N-acetyltransferase n=1 Tax=Actinocatenispora rupis TaxID=519421 RepID=A0A8J3IX49_9ACTN|nr:GNAT family protein [Actinocatenispora rupis]GID10298.1 ribosomal-protein-alanine N-acetyltransferase [Actinocatenispora rupis]
MNAHPGWPAVLTDGDVTLRPYTRADAAAWVEVRLANEAWLSPWEPDPPGRWQDVHTVRAFRYVYRDLKRSAADGSTMPWAVCWQGTFVGQLTIGNIVRRAFCSGYAGYWIDHRHAGKGITPTALALAVDHAFGRGGLHRVEVNIRPENKPSRRVVEKLGFREESYHHRYLYIAGGWRDHLGYALTTEDVAADGGLLARLHRNRSDRPTS